MSRAEPHVHDAVHALYPEHIVTRYALVAEAIDPEDRGRVLVLDSPDDSKAWDTYGLLRYALAIEDATTSAEG